jgi:hypothetical protein
MIEQIHDGLLRAARNIYVKAQGRKSLKKRTLSAGSLSDRALNKVLGFAGQEQRLNYLKIQNGVSHLRGTPRSEETAVQTAHRTTSEFAEFTSEFFRTGLFLLQQAARDAYVKVQGLSIIGGRVLDNGSATDRALNKVLGFENQRERLEYLMARTVSSNAAKMIEILRPAVEGDASVSRRELNRINLDLLFVVQSRLMQLRLDDDISRFIGVGLKPKQR